MPFDVCVPLQEHVPSAATFVQDLQQRWEEAKAAMQAAQGRQKRQADHRRRTGDIKEGDWVLLSTANI